MTSGLLKFLEGIIDYAGLLPPAELPMDEAIRNYSRYRQESDSWMLARFICPANRLIELEVYKELMADDYEPYMFSIVGRPSLDLSDFEKLLKETIQEITDFHHYHGSSVVTDTLELSFPKMMVSHADHYAAIQRAGRVIDTLSSVPMKIFFEVVQSEDWFGNITNAVQAISDFNAEKSALMMKKVGINMRSGGLMPMIPGVEEIAHVLTLCRDENIPFKATSGLQHPVRYFDETYQVWAHGFINVFMAGILAHSHRLPDIIILSILEEDDPESFFFNEDYIGWREVRLSVDKLHKLREEKIISLGSCSFDAPREDLISLNLL